MNRRRGSGRATGWLVAVLVMQAALGRWACGDAPPPVRHVYLGCSPVEADALYGQPEQRNRVAAVAPALWREQRIYAAGRGRKVEIWFGDAGVERILLPDGNDLETIHQILDDSEPKGAWTLEGRVWRHSDGEVAAAVIGEGTLAVGPAPWLAALLEAEARRAAGGGP